MASSPGFTVADVPRQSGKCLVTGANTDVGCSARSKVRNRVRLSRRQLGVAITTRGQAQAWVRMNRCAGSALDMTAGYGVEAATLPVTPGLAATLAGIGAALLQ
jgi:hypothetical protein